MQAHVISKTLHRLHITPPAYLVCLAAVPTLPVVLAVSKATSEEISFPGEMEYSRVENIL